MHWDWTVVQYVAYIFGSLLFAAGSAIGLVQYLSR
jgi:hypothetical protein